MDNAKFFKTKSNQFHLNMRWSNLKIEILPVDRRMCSLVLTILSNIFVLLTKKVKMERTIFSKILELTSYLLILFVILKGYLHSASHPICIEIQISFDWLTSELGSPFVENYLLTIAFKDPNNRSRFDWTVNYQKYLIVYEQSYWHSFLWWVIAYI